MRVPKPVGGAIDIARYAENHNGLPLTMRLYMGSARSTVATITLGVAVFISYLAFGSLAAVMTWIIGLNVFNVIRNSAFDFFQPFGFHAFRWLLRQRD